MTLIVSSIGWKFVTADLSADPSPAPLLSLFPQSGVDMAFIHAVE